MTAGRKPDNQTTHTENGQNRLARFWQNVKIWRIVKRTRGVYKTLQFRLVAGFVAVLVTALTVPGIVTGVSVFNAAAEYERQIFESNATHITELFHQSFRAGNKQGIADAIKIAGEAYNWYVVARLPGDEYIYPESPDYLGGDFPELVRDKILEPSEVEFLGNKELFQGYRRKQNNLVTVSDDITGETSGDGTPNTFASEVSGDAPPDTFASEVSGDNPPDTFASEVSGDSPPADLTNVDVRALPTDTSEIYVVDLALIDEVANAVASAPSIVEPTVESLTATFRDSLLISGSIAGVGGILLIFYGTRRSLRPLATLTTWAGKIGRGEKTDPIREAGAGEVRRLTNSFNTMLANLQAAKKRRQRITSDTAHELRTPISNLKGYIEAIDDGVVEPNDKTMSLLRSQTSHLEKLVNDLYLIAIANEGELRIDKIEGDLGKLAQQVVNDFSPRATENGVKLVINEAELRCEFDEQRMRQVLSNLIDNALRYTPPKGRVEVRVERRSGDEYGTAITVSDSGSGIPKDDLPKIFEEYYRADSSRSQTTGGGGLGLTIVSKLVKLHGGTVEVESELGKGTTFTVLL